MKSISFAWTSPAFVARVKTVTRRQWRDEYARQWAVGDQFRALDKSFRAGGREIGIGRVSYFALEPIHQMSDADYEHEGFAYLHRFGIANAGRYPTRRNVFDAWRESGESFWVIRFQILSITPYGEQLRREFERAHNARTMFDQED